jgi:CheY-like chemotaxis protein
MLAVDDSPLNLLLLQVFLGGGGYRVACTADPSEALGLARAGGVDLITLDLYMEPLDGWAMLDELRGDPTTREIPVIIVSVVDTNDVPDLADGHIGKPVDITALLRALTDLELTETRR